VCTLLCQGVRSGARPNTDTAQAEVAGTRPPPSSAATVGVASPATQHATPPLHNKQKQTGTGERGIKYVVCLIAWAEYKTACSVWWPSGRCPLMSRFHILSLNVPRHGIAHCRELDAARNAMERRAHVSEAKSFLPKVSVVKSVSNRETRRAAG